MTDVQQALVPLGKRIKYLLTVDLSLLIQHPFLSNLSKVLIISYATRNLTYCGIV